MKYKTTLIKVAVPGPFDEGLDYSLPENLTTIAIGSRVSVPLRARHVLGIVIATNITPTISHQKIKPIIEVMDEAPLFSESHIEFCHWLGQYYHFPVGDIMISGMPQALKQKKDWRPNHTSICLSHIGKSADISNHKAPRQKQLLTLLQAQESIDIKSLKGMGISRSTVQTLIQKGWINESTQTAPQHTTRTIKPRPYSLTAEHQSAISIIQQQLKCFKVFALEGITGSGKQKFILRPFVK